MAVGRSISGYGDPRAVWGSFSRLDQSPTPCARPYPSSNRKRGKEKRREEKGRGGEKKKRSPIRFTPRRGCIDAAQPSRGSQGPAVSMADRNSTREKRWQDYYFFFFFPPNHGTVEIKKHKRRGFLSNFKEKESFGRNAIIDERTCRKCRFTAQLLPPDEQ